MNRRAFLTGAGLVALTGVTGLAATAGEGLALGRPAKGSVLRIGAMTNLTHAPMIAGIGSGRLARALSPVVLEPSFFRAGPRVTEALVGDAIDVGLSGPAPVVLHHLRHKKSGRGLRVLAGCASGGASFVVRRNAGISGPNDLHGKRLAVTQIGTTQDIALRSYMNGHGLVDEISGGDVRVIAVHPSTILAQLKQGELDGAWLAEPWATRVVCELDAVRLVDERDLWEGHRFATAVLAVRADRGVDPIVTRLLQALAEEVERAVRDPETTRDEAYQELRKHVGNPGARPIFDAAWSFVDFTSDPERGSIERLAVQAHAIGLCNSADVSDLFG